MKHAACYKVFALSEFKEIGKLYRAMADFMTELGPRSFIQITGNENFSTTTTESRTIPPASSIEYAGYHCVWYWRQVNEEPHV